MSDEDLTKVDCPNCESNKLKIVWVDDTPGGYYCSGYDMDRWGPSDRGCGKFWDDETLAMS